MSAGERIIYEDGGVLVSTARIVAGGQTFAVRSVGAVRSEAVPAIRNVATNACLLLSAAAAFTAGAMLNGTAFAVVLAAGVAASVAVYRTTPLHYRIALSVAGGVFYPLSGLDLPRAQRILGAINGAIIAADSQPSPSAAPLAAPPADGEIKLPPGKSNWL